AGRVLLLLAEVGAEQAAPVPLIGLLEHPLVRAGEGRAAWLEQARALELALRGPRLAPGLEPVRAAADKARVGRWWSEVEAIFAPLMEVAAAPLGEQLDRPARARPTRSREGAVA